MSAIDIQLEPEIAPLSEPIAVTSAHRWIDLSLVLAVAFANSILGSIFLAFHPDAPKYSDPHLFSGILAEATALLLFLVLFKRQGRNLKDIGLSFRWTDLPTALGLAVAAFFSMWAAWIAIYYGWFFLTLRS